MARKRVKLETPVEEEVAPALVEEEKPEKTRFTNEVDEKVYKWYMALNEEAKFNIYQAAEQLQLRMCELEQSLERMKGKQLPENLTHITPS